MAQTSHFAPLLGPKLGFTILVERWHCQQSSSNPTHESYHPLPSQWIPTIQSLTDRGEGGVTFRFF